MFKRLFSKPKPEEDTVVTLDKLNETLEMLEKKETQLQNKVNEETQKAKEFSVRKNKRAAIQCLKKRRLYEHQMQQLINYQMRIHDQMIMLEGAKATTETVDALRIGAACLKAEQKTTNIHHVDKIMNEIDKQTENMRQIHEALSAPVGAAAHFDEDELEAELEELEELETADELEKQLLQPAMTDNVAPVQVPIKQQHTHHVHDKHTSEVDELATLHAEMSLEEGNLCMMTHDFEVGLEVYNS